MELFALALFAQQKRGAGGGGADADAGLAGLGMIMCFYGVIIAASIVVQIFFLLTMSRCLKQISRRNRQMEPGQVWLCLIPIFGFVWTILMIIRVADSLADEYYDRGLRGDGDFGKTLGIVYLVSAFVCGPVALVVFIMYWVKIAGYTRELIADRGGGGYGDYDDRDDRPRRKKKRRDEEEEEEEEEEEDEDEDDRR
jgi:hypothetical protein